MKWCLSFACSERRQQRLSAPLLCGTHGPCHVVTLIGFCSVSMLCNHTHKHTHMHLDSKQYTAFVRSARLSADFGALVGSFWAFWSNLLGHNPLRLFSVSPSHPFCLLFCSSLDHYQSCCLQSLAAPIAVWCSSLLVAYCLFSSLPLCQWNLSSTGQFSAKDSWVIDGSNVSFCVPIDGWKSTVELLVQRHVRKTEQQQQQQPGGCWVISADRKKYRSHS